MHDGASSNGTLRNDLLLRAARRQPTPRTPVWLMRQAGRSDPAYRALREKMPLPLEELFARPDLAAEISLLPRRIGVDAIILFQDILTPLAPMGARFVFRPGPVLESPIRNSRDLDRLHSFDPRTELDFVAQALRLLHTEINGALPLLGFAGAPLTLAFFLLEGHSPGASADRAKMMMRDEPERFRSLLDLLTDITIDYLNMQVDAGADVVQLFESISHLVSRQEYESFAHPCHVRIFAGVKNVPTILFVREQPFVDLMADSGADVLSIGRCVDLNMARRDHGSQVAFQGNVDNQLLIHGSKTDIDAAVRQCLREGGGRGHILNLNHGVLADTPFDNVCQFIETCQSTIIDVDEDEQ
jgi:uroporphyrinogen decarboxylase